MVRGQAKRGRGRPSAESSQAIEEQILDFARLHFTKRGFANTSLADIAESLGASKHTIYRRFQGKEAVFDAVVQRDVQRFLSATEQIFHAGANTDSIRRWARFYFDQSRDERYASLYLYMKAEAAISRTMRRKLGLLQSVALAPLGSALGDLRQQRILRFDDVAQVCGVLTSLLDGGADIVRNDRSLTAEKINDTFAERWNIFLKIFATIAEKNEPE